MKEAKRDGPADGGLRCKVRIPDLERGGYRTVDYAPPPEDADKFRQGHGSDVSFSVGTTESTGGYLMPPDLRDDVVRKVSEMNLARKIEVGYREARRSLADMPRGVVDRVLLRLGLVRKAACLDLLAETIARKNAKISEVRRAGQTEEAGWTGRKWGEP